MFNVFTDMAANKINNKDEIPQYNYRVQELPEELRNLPDRVSATLIGKTVLITGGSGFLGKVLIEKLLRKCPAITKIFLLIRNKKGKDPEQRIVDLFSSPVSRFTLPEHLC